MPTMTFPEARARLLLIAEALRQPRVTPDQRGRFADELIAIEARVKRRPPARRAMPRALGMDDVLRERIRAYARQHPTMSLRKIGAQFNVDGGRVSEALHGFRDALEDA